MKNATKIAVKSHFSLGLLTLMLLVVTVGFSASFANSEAFADTKGSASEISQAKEKLNSLYDKAAEANEQLNATNVMIDQTKQQISDLNAQIDSAQQEIASKQDELEQSKAQLAQAVAADYRQSNSRF